MDRSRNQLTAVAAVVFLIFAAVLFVLRLDASLSAQEQIPPGRAAVSATTATLLQYQGRLSDPQTGQPVPDGSYTLALRLYSQPSGGTPLWAEVEDVPVRGGLFSTVLGDTATLKQDLFDGRALWLGVKVGADAEAAPRQQLLPVAYALGLVPGAVIDGDLTVKGDLKGSHAADAEAHHQRYTDGEAVQAALDSPEIVTQYEFEDHVYGGMHSGRAIAYAVIDENGGVLSSSGNVSCKWNNIAKQYEITIDGHNYDWRSYVTVVTPVLGGIPSAFSVSGSDKLYVGIYKDSSSPGLKTPFSFVTYQP